MKIECTVEEFEKLIKHTVEDTDLKKEYLFLTKKGDEEDE